MEKFDGLWQPGQPHVQKAYGAVNEAFLSDDILWAEFKRAPTYNGIVGGDTRSKEVGQAFVNIIRQRFPYLIDMAHIFGMNDTIGGPFIYKYDGCLSLSPGTLAYMYVMGDIQEHITGVNAKTKIVEVGPGYGGQCLLFTMLYPIAQYNLIDLPQSLLVIKKYLEIFKGNTANTEVNFYDTNAVPSNNIYDIAISNYCLSELDDKGMDFYLRNVICKSRYAYIQSNLECTEHVAWANKGRFMALIAKLQDIYEDVSWLQLEDEISAGFKVDRIFCKGNKLL